MKEIYILGCLIVNSLLLLWFFSPLKTTISEIFLKKPLLPLEFDDYIFFKSKVLGKLLTCWICLSFWLSLVVGLIMSLIFNLNISWPFICFLTYPCLSYIFYKYISK